MLRKDLMLDIQKEEVCGKNINKYKVTRVTARWRRARNWFFSHISDSERRFELHKRKQLFDTTIHVSRERN